TSSTAGLAPEPMRWVASTVVAAPAGPWGVVRRTYTPSMAVPTIAEAVVLGSFAFGEADGVLHVYSLASGRVGAVAKGVRRTKSGFGGRLDPLSHVDRALHR